MENLFTEQNVQTSVSFCSKSELSSFLSSKIEFGIPNPQGRRAIIANKTVIGFVSHKYDANKPLKIQQFQNLKDGRLFYVIMNHGLKIDSGFDIE